MIQNVPSSSPQNVQNSQYAPMPRAFAPSYNAVQINLDTPTLNVPQQQGGYYYNYPQASGPIAYQPTNMQPVNVPPPQNGQTNQPQLEQTVNTVPAQTPAANDTTPNNDVDMDKVVKNLSDPDYEIQANQMDEIAKKGLKDEASVVPYLKEDVYNKLFDIMNVDSSKLDGPTEQQRALRAKQAENDEAIQKAKDEGKDENSVQLPNQLTPEEVELANTITPAEKAERNKEYALFTTAILQKAYGNEIEKRSGDIVPMTDLPGAAMVVNELKENQNPAIRTAAIDALRFIKRPEYKNDLTTVFTIAKSDSDENVAKAADDALQDINK